MNVATLEMEPEVAREKLKAYRARKHKDAEQEYAAAITLLEAVQKGHQVINVGDAIAECPRDEKGRPMLAIARADRREVEFFSRSWQSSYTFNCAKVTETDSLTKTFIRPSLLKAHRGYATVPMVPADVRPETGQLKDWYILFEVEQWHDMPIVDPPIDPLLLEHIQGDFYRIIAEWDLTEIERAAMQMALAN